MATKTRSLESAFSLWTANSLLHAERLFPHLCIVQIDFHLIVTYRPVPNGRQLEEKLVFIAFPVSIVNRPERRMGIQPLLIQRIPARLKICPSFDIAHIEKD